MSARGAGFPELLALLGHQADDAVVVCHQRSGGPFMPTWTTADKAPDIADDHAEADVWFGVNALPHKGTGRGGAADVTRLAALYADLDVKPGGMPSMAAAVAVITTLSEMLEAKPAAVVESGHGRQPYWPIDPDDPAGTITSPTTRADIAALLRRFGRLVAHVAGIHGGQVDSVFDLARVLRVPGLTNYKADPVPTLVSVTGSRLLTVAHVDDRLTAYNAVEQPGDRDQLGTVVAPAAEWSSWATTTHPAVHAAVRSWQQQTPKGRHPWLLGCATSLAFARRLGMVTEADHAAALVVLQERFRWLLAHHGQPRTKTPGEVADCLTFGVAKAESKPEADAYADWSFWVSPLAADTDPTADDDLDGSFWSARPSLAHIHQHARAVRAGPWAVLGVVLARVVVATPPHVVLPPLVGSDASLNMFAGVVGDSGSGKGAACRAAADAVHVGLLNLRPVGSGEGLTHTFVKRTKSGDIEQHTQAVLGDIPEVDTLAALGSRNGSTLLPLLRQAYMGELLGFGYADPTKRLTVQEHQYRLCLTIGIQPRRSGVLLDDADGGTPQRLLWLPALDRNAPDDPPDRPERMRWQLPSLPPYDRHDGRIRLPVCDSARQAVDEARLSTIRGDAAALDGHALLARLKVGAALALLDGRAEVAEDDWTLAGTVLDVSDRTRGRVVETLRRTSADTNRARAEAEGERAVVVVEKVEDAAVRRVAQLLTRKLAATPAGMQHAVLRRRVTSADRKHFDAAIDRLLDAGQDTCEGIGGQGTDGVHYRVSDGAR